MKKFLLFSLFSFVGFSSNAQFIEPFDDASVAAPTGNTWALPSGTWRILNNGVGTQHFTMSPEGSTAFPANTQPHAAFIARENIGAGNTSIDYLVTPATPIPGSNSTFRFNTRTTISGNQFSTYELRAAPASSDPTDMASFTTLLAAWTEDGIAMPFNTYQSKTISLGQLETAQSYYFAFVRTLTQPDDNISGDRWLIDDVAVIPACDPPSGLTATPSASFINLSWQAGTSAQWEVHVVQDGQNFDPQSGTPITVSGSPMVFLDEMTQPGTTGLQPATAYKIFVRSVCEFSTSEWIGPIMCTTNPLPLECGGMFVDSGGVAGNYSPNENSVITICPEQPGEAVLVTFTAFNTEVGWDALYVYDGNSIASPQILSMNASGNVPGGLPGGYWGTTIPGPFESSSADGCLTFWFRSDSAITLPGFVANVSCNVIGNCPKPLNLAIVGATPTTATFSWAEAANATSWEVLALPCGSPSPNFSTVGIPVTATTYTFTDLSANTCYEFYVRANCSDVTSAWAGPAGNETENTTRFLLKAFVDDNDNGVADSNEPLFTFGTFSMEINDSGDVSQFVSNSGQIIIPEPDPTATYDFTFSIFPEFSTYYSIAQNQQLNIPAPATNTTTEILFPISMDQTYTEVSVVILSPQPPRAGMNWNNSVSIRNNGTGSASGTLTFAKDPVTTSISVSPIGPVLNANGFSHTFTNLPSGGVQWFSTDMLVPNIPQVAIDQPLTNSADVTVDGDIDTSNNAFSITRLVTASYDPNDIFESHGPQIIADEFAASEYLYYTIRFQNTGNAEAFDVRIENTLDTQLDAQSIRMVAASHDYVMERSGNDLIWKFNDINLTWQSQSEELSQGYVVYKIRANAGFESGDVIPALAEIYFDGNPAIVTETFTTTFTDALSSPDFNQNSIALFPNPASSSFTVKSQQAGTHLSKVIVTDLLGKNILVAQIDVADEVPIDVSGLSKGMYLVEITTSDNLKTVKKLVVK
ncbi:T9SS type A sorting domain-containing protein [Flavobacterium sp.]|uniref:DUF7619 domain-containing protein n=1 Tax=Flavobacterium sp. TaxID=239 RepID=UPI0025BA58E0|nr:T9SS type A sorting domain-containing protein [Flavobacterium sp.]